MFRVRFCWLAGLIATIGSPVLSQAQGIGMELNPAPGITARIVRHGDNVDLIQPLGFDISLGKVYESNYNDLRITQADVDFDGHPDLIARKLRGGEELVQIIRYRPELRSYRELAPPDDPHTPMRCGMQEPEVDTAARALVVHCTADATKVTEALRFDASGSPWLASRKLEGGGVAETMGIFGQIVRWDRQGRETEVRAYSAKGAPVYRLVTAERAYLYRVASEDSETAAYLVRGDTVRVLAAEPGWLRIAYQGKAGRIDRWAQADDIDEPVPAP